jgi:hypothetical protein
MMQRGVKLQNKKLHKVEAKNGKILEYESGAQVNTSDEKHRR